MALRGLGLALLCALVAFGVRRVHAIARPLAAEPARALPAALESVDPDSQYHARRVARALEAGGAVAQRDPLLAWPVHAAEGGAPIPWPPYYDAALAALARLRLGHGVADLTDAGVDDAADAAAQAHERVRRIAADTVARAPAWLAALTAALACLAAATLARGAEAARGRGLEGQRTERYRVLLAGALGGLGVALSFAHLRYSYLGMGDHHTAVACLHVALLAVVARAVAPDALRGPRLSAVRGAGAGLLAGALLGTWVASLALVVAVQATFAWLLLRPGRPAPVGLALCAASFHKAVVLALLPAALVSPWSDTRALDVVNLSWFHVAWFGVSWFAFAPVVFLPRSRARRLPALGAAVALLGLTLAARHGAREALDWATATERFMASIAESQPFDSLAAATKWLGVGAWLGAPALLLAAAAVVTRRDDRLLPWVLAVLVLGVAAVYQRRFAEGLAAPLAVLVGWFVATLVGHVLRRRGARAGGVVALLAGSLALAHVGTLRATRARLPAPRFVRTDTAAAHDAVAETLGTLRACDPLEPRGVLAEWDHGHAIEWWAEAPSLATNFGPYLGRDAFLDPWRCLLSEDDASAEALALQRQVSHLFVTFDARRNLAAAASALGLPPLDEVAWRRTLAARLIATDRSDGEPHPAFLRLCAARPVDGPGGRAPYARLYERVQGATVVVRGAPGARVALRMRVAAADGGLLWSVTGEVSAAGTCELRVPYPTEGGAPDAEGYASSAELDVERDVRALSVRLEDVRSGARLQAGD